VFLLLVASCKAQERPKIYVLTQNHGCRITAYKTDGVQVDPDIRIGGYGCSGIAVDSAGRILVTSLGPNGGAMAFDEHGNGRQFIHTGTASAIAIGPQGILHLLLAINTDHFLVRRYRADGSPMNGQMLIQMNNVSGIAVDKAEKVYALAKGGEKVKVFEPNGYQMVQMIKTGSVPKAIALTPDGKIYVAAYQTVECYLPNGQMDHPTLTHANPDGGYDFPTALAVDHSGEIYVGYYDGFVAILDKDGKPKGDGFKAVENEIVGLAVR
jgi:DNA-binding beta-propeller fold protein YncE